MAHDALAALLHALPQDRLLELLLDLAQLEPALEQRLLLAVGDDRAEGSRAPSTRSCALAASSTTAT